MKGSNWGKIILLAITVVMIAIPGGCTAMGNDIESDSMAAGASREVTWDWSSIGLCVGLVIAVVVAWFIYTTWTDDVRAAIAEITHSKPKGKKDSMAKAKSAAASVRQRHEARVAFEEDYYYRINNMVDYFVNAMQGKRRNGMSKAPQDFLHYESSLNQIDYIPQAFEADIAWWATNPTDRSKTTSSYACITNAGEWEYLGNYSSYSQSEGSTSASIQPWTFSSYEFNTVEFLHEGTDNEGPIAITYAQYHGRVLCSRGTATAEHAYHCIRDLIENVLRQYNPRALTNLPT